MICFSLLFLRCKYLYLLFNDSFLANQNYVFTTEGHPFPVRSAWHEKLPETYALNNWTTAEVCFEILEILSKCLFDFIFEMPIKIFRILNLNNKDLLALCQSFLWFTQCFNGRNLAKIWLTIFLGDFGPNEMNLPYRAFYLSELNISKVVFQCFPSFFSDDDMVNIDNPFKSGFSSQLSESVI